MTLEEKIRAYAAKGELVHLSLAFSNGAYDCRYAAASPAGGYSMGSSDDPVEAIEKAFKAAPIKTPRVSKRDTATVTEPSDLSGMPDGVEPSDLHGLPNDWTSP
jgi:hypothetical protein